MKTFYRFSVLLILPVLFFVLTLMCRQDLFIGNNYDPSYVYLINSLNLMQLSGYGVGHIDHPGTPVQMIGAIVIFISSLSSKDIVTDIFNNPEHYLSSINLLFSVLNTIALFILGYVSLKKLKDLNSAVILQLTPFFSTIMYHRIPRLAPESALIFTVLVLLAISISYISNQDEKHWLRYVIGFSLVSGFAIALKISFFPLLVIPVILLRKFSMKTLFAGLTIAAFLIFILPALSTEHFYKFLNWIRKLTMFSGKYGGGEKNYVNVPNFFQNLRTIIVYEPVFFIFYILISVFTLTSFIPEFFKEIKSNGYYRFLIAIFLSITIQIIIVCKHFELHYLLPAQLLIVPGLFAVYKLFMALFPGLFKKRKYLTLNILLAFFGIFQLRSFSEFHKYKIEQDKSSAEFIRQTEENFKNELKVVSYGVSSKGEAMFIGSSYGGSRRNFYFTKLNEKYPDNLYYDKWSKEIINVESPEITKAKILNSKKFLFLTNDENVLNDFTEALSKIAAGSEINVKKVYSNFTGESIYEIELANN